MSNDKDYPEDISLEDLQAYIWKENKPDAKALENYLSFFKWEGLGNDFVIITEESRLETAGELAREVCDRHFGIGADGLIFLLHNDDEVRMEIFNADGSKAAMCGNGIRCLAALALREKIVKEREFTVQTASGPKAVRITDVNPWKVRVDMGEPQILGREKIKLACGEECESVAVSMGNPHRVVFVVSLDKIDAACEGRVIDENTTDGVNVEFIENTAEGLKVKVWERGCGLTLACGTGACACMAAANHLGIDVPSGKVILPGGVLEVNLENGHAFMTGPARETFRGTYFVKS